MGAFFAVSVHSYSPDQRDLYQEQIQYLVEKLEAYQVKSEKFRDIITSDYQKLLSAVEKEVSGDMSENSLEDSGEKESEEQGRFEQRDEELLEVQENSKVSDNPQNAVERVQKKVKDSALNLINQPKRIEGKLKGLANKRLGDLEEDSPEDD